MPHKYIQEQFPQ